jgi:hypothetical protein
VIIFQQLFYQVATNEPEAARDDHMLSFHVESQYSRL